MKRIVLNVDDGRYALFLQFLKTLNYVHVVQAPLVSQKKARKNPPTDNRKQHFLDDVIGIMDNESGAELEEIVNREFQQIEGEW